LLQSHLHDSLLVALESVNKPRVVLLQEAQRGVLHSQIIKRQNMAEGKGSGIAIEYTRVVFCAFVFLQYDGAQGLACKCADADILYIGVQEPCLPVLNAPPPPHAHTQY
jgi:hypothetical protein